MSAKEYLKSTKEMKSVLKGQYRLYEVLDKELNRITASMSGMPGNPSPEISRMAENANRLMDLKEEIMEKETELKRRLKKVRMLLGGKELLLVEIRYFEDRDWVEVARIMRIAISSVYRIHNNALKDLEKNWNEQM